MAGAGVEVVVTAAEQRMALIVAGSTPGCVTRRLRVVCWGMHSCYREQRLWRQAKERRTTRHCDQNDARPHKTLSIWERAWATNNNDSVLSGSEGQRRDEQNDGRTDGWAN